MTTPCQVPAGIPPDEAARLTALQAYHILDTDFEADYDALCALAAAICGTPIALISLVDRDRQWFKAAVGLGVRETPRDIAFCAHAIWQDHIFEIPDATADPRFANNPLVTGEPDIRFYAGQPLIAPSGHALGTLCAIDRVPRTLDDRQREALRILGRQVVANLELRRAMADLKRLNADKDLFFSIIAHDLRTPFTGLLGLTEVLVAEGTAMPPQNLAKYLGVLHRSASKAYELFENLLRWALLQQGKMTFEPEVLAVPRLLEQAVAPLHQGMKAKGLTLQVHCPPEGAIRGDRNMLEAALRNLLSNAVKFSPAGGCLGLTASRVGAQWRITVQDSGQGLSAEQLAQLQAGLRAGTRRGTGGESGTGLGLTLVRQFAEQHGGQLELSSTEGQGTTATLVLPA